MRMHRSRDLLQQIKWSALAGAAVLTSATYADNLLQNGDFAEGETCGVWCVTNCDIPGWIAQKIDWQPTAAGMEDPGAISINGCTAGSMEQTVTVTPGIPYRLLVRWDAQVNSYLTYQSATVLVGSDAYLLEDITTSTPTWEVLDAVIVPETSTVTVRLVSNHGSDQGIYFDYVRLEPVASDCNGNGIADDQDIAAGYSDDCDLNGVPDECQDDSDGDGAIDPCDGCPDDPAKSDPGICGCGVPDVDSDADGVLDCEDGCPDDPFKIEPGACGCGVSDDDADGNGIPDCGEGSFDELIDWPISEGGNGHLYARVVFGVAVGWPQANAFAASVGGHLVTLTSEEEETLIENYLMDLPQRRGWIGLYQDLDAPDYSEPDGGWRWVTGEPLEYTAWLRGEPSNNSIDGLPEDFGMINGINNEPPLGWNDRSSPFTQAIIEWSADCDGDGVVDYRQIVEGTAPDVDDDGVPDWCRIESDCNGNGLDDMHEVAYQDLPPHPLAVKWPVSEGGNGHWYLISEEQRDRVSADLDARSRGGYLATFTDPGELLFFRQNFAPICCVAYVGGQQELPGLEPRGSWKWDTNEPWSGVPWKRGEPNDSATVGGAERYLQIYTSNSDFGTFNDATGFTPRRYVIEWDPASDCDGDGVLDGCQLGSGLETDLNGNRVMDGCEAIIVPDDASSIQSAINQVADGGVVLVREGTYVENLMYPEGVDFVLASTSGPDVTIIDGSTADDSTVRILGGQTNASRLIGFTITGGRTGSIATPLGGAFLAGGGLFSASTDVEIRNCFFTGNRSTFGGNVYLYDHHGEIRNCVFTDGEASSDGGNLMLFRCEDVVAGCIFRGGSAANDGGGVKVVNGFVDMLTCLVEDNDAQTGGGVMYFETEGEATRFNFHVANVSGNTAKFGGGFWARPTGSGPQMTLTRVCGNLPDNFFGPYVDLGSNQLCDCPGDLNADGEVNGTDLGLLLVYAGDSCDPGSPCPGDLTGDGMVNGADLGVLLSSWGLCP